MTIKKLPTVFSSDKTGVPLDKAPGAQPNWDTERFVTVTELLSTWPDPILHSVPKNNVLVFLLLSRPIHSRARWSIPDFETASDFINEVKCSAYGGDFPYAGTYVRSVKWGRFPTIFLSTEDPGLSEEFRKLLARSSFNGLDYDTFPKNVVVAKPNISILLRHNMKFSLSRFC